MNLPTPTEGDIWFDDVDADDTEAAIGSEAAMPVQKRKQHLEILPHFVFRYPALGINLKKLPCL